MNTRACSGNVELPHTVQVRRVLAEMKLITLKPLQEGQVAQAQLARERRGWILCKEGSSLLPTSNAHWQFCSVPGPFFYLLKMTASFSSEKPYLLKAGFVAWETWSAKLIRIFMVKGSHMIQAWRMSIFHLLDYGDWLRDQWCWT